MLFNSFRFVELLLATLLLYYLPALRRWQVPLLLLASFIFYAYSHPLLLLLLLASAGINALASYAVAFGPSRRRRAYAVGGVAANLATLMFFKYSPLVGGTFFDASAGLGAFLVAIPLPVGISFFTFQGISLVVDVFTERYWKNETLLPREWKPFSLHTLLFIVFFPQLVAGPIVKAHDFLPQIRSKYWRDIRWEAVFKALVVGYFLKMVVADNLKDFTFWMEFPFFKAQSTPALLAMLLGYSAQIFADFAGYSLIAIGLARLFGYELHENFQFPYISTSFSEFWRRWHISLSSFLKEYLYIPLGGNRNGKVRTYFNLLLTMVLGGIWHGAAWSYAVWGLAHGLGLAVERLVNDRWPFRAPQWLAALRGLWVFAYVTLAWLLFKLPEFSQVISYLQAIGTNGFLGNDAGLIAHIAIYSFPVWAYHAWYLLSRRPRWAAWQQQYSYWVYGAMLFMIAVNSGSSGAFIYFQF
jgi:alginate O-acetyltransferase complex protein AlgI